MPEEAPLKKPPGIIRFCIILLLAFVGFWSLLFSLWVWEDFLARVFLTCLVLIFAIGLSIVGSLMLEDPRDYT